MKCMENQLASKWPKIATIPCVLHLINLACQSFLSSPGNTEASENVIKLASFYNKSTHSAGLMSSWGEKNNVSGKITTFSPTRWFGFDDTCQSIIKFQKAFEAIYNLNSNEGKDNFKRLPLKMKTLVHNDFLFCDKNAD